MCEALHRELPGIRFVEPDGGFSVWIELDDTGDELDLLEAAIAEGTCIDPGHSFRPRDSIAAGAPLAFRASFSSAPSDRIAEGVRRLARAIERWRQQTTRRGA